MIILKQPRTLHENVILLLTFRNHFSKFSKENDIDNYPFVLKVLIPLAMIGDMFMYFQILYINPL